MPTRKSALSHLRELTRPPRIKRSGVVSKPVQWRVSQSDLLLDTPVGREHPAMIEDPLGRRVLLLGGGGYAPYGTSLDDGWYFDFIDQAWWPLVAEGRLPGGVSRRVCVLHEARVAYLFGGLNADPNSVMTPHNELIRVNFAGDVVRFETVSQRNAPRGRVLHGFFVDRAESTFYVFGGFTDGPTSEMWRMQFEDGVAVWEQLELPIAPSPRFGFCGAFDPLRRRYWLFSGASGRAPYAAARDLWAFELENDAPRWRCLMKGDALPAGRRHASSVFDPERQQFWIYGGSTDTSALPKELLVFDCAGDEVGCREVRTMGAPEPRAGGTAFFDITEREAYFAFGRSHDARGSDLSVLRLARVGTVQSTQATG